MKIHHFGYAVSNLEKAIELLNSLFDMDTIKNPIEDLNQKVKIAFLKSKESPLFELLEPLGKDSPVYGKIGLVHICFECEDINKEIEKLRKKGFLLFRKVEKAKAIDEKEIAFLYNKELGVIELIQK